MCVSEGECVSKLNSCIFKERQKLETLKHNFSSKLLIFSRARKKTFYSRFKLESISFVGIVCVVCVCVCVLCVCGLCVCVFICVVCLCVVGCVCVCVCVCVGV